MIFLIPLERLFWNCIRRKLRFSNIGNIGDMAEYRSDYRRDENKNIAHGWLWGEDTSRLLETSLPRKSMKMKMTDIPPAFLLKFDDGWSIFVYFSLLSSRQTAKQFLQLCATCCFAGSGKRVQFKATGGDAGKKNVCCATSVVCSRLTSLHQMSCSTDMKDTIPTKAENTIVLNKYYGFHLQEWNEAAVGNRSLQIDLLQP